MLCGSRTQKPPRHGHSQLPLLKGANQDKLLTAQQTPPPSCSGQMWLLGNGQRGGGGGGRAGESLARRLFRAGNPGSLFPKAWQPWDGRAAAAGGDKRSSRKCASLLGRPGKEARIPMTGAGLGAAAERKSSQRASGPFGALGCRAGAGVG